MAVCLIAGYAWLAVTGGIWLIAGASVDGPGYGAAVHAVLLGFVMSMVMAHAPVTSRYCAARCRNDPLCTSRWCCCTPR
jgi:hypothetical protein